MIQRYLGRISGPLLDRIDLHIEVPAVPYRELRGKDGGISSADIRARVEHARSIQSARGFLQFVQIPVWNPHPARVVGLAALRRKHSSASTLSARGIHVLDDDPGASRTDSTSGSRPELNKACVFAVFFVRLRDRFVDGFCAEQHQRAHITRDGSAVVLEDCFLAWGQRINAGQPVDDLLEGLQALLRKICVHDNSIKPVLRQGGG